MVQRLVDALAQPYTVEAQLLRCTVSIGIVLSHQVTGDADAVLQDASIAMVEAKRSGGSRFTVFEPSMQQRAVQRSGLESDLRQALAPGQFFLVYQPVVGLQGAGGGFDRAVGVQACPPTTVRVHGTAP